MKYRNVKEEIKAVTKELEEFERYERVNTSFMICAWAIAGQRRCRRKLARLYEKERIEREKEHN